MSMVEERTRSSRRDAMLDRLGGPPGVYVVACVVLAVVWFPFRLLLDRGDPIPRIIAASALNGALWPLIPIAGEWGLRLRRKIAGSADAVPSTPTPGYRAWARRGAIVGLAVGMPSFGALIALCLITGRSWAYTTSFAVILVVIVAISAKSMRKSTATSTI
ncbi:hypothetical protein AB0G04_19270 [Actinoplanes sp. NPDC023801]|uniref:hypothetical protein n=1 Tax=Actinoplanes sp. NPDC023801 TaxID=3154595 RepID=UPI0033D25716